MPKHDPIPRRGIANPHAWARYRRIMRWMLVLSLVCVAGAVSYVRLVVVPVSWPMMIATGVGVFLTVMVGTGLMSLVFLSAGSGHDADAADPFDGEHP